jgi:hypothetical protein
MASQRIVERRGANHGLHVFLSLITCGIWAITGWPIATAMGRKTVTRVPVAPPPPQAYPQPPAQPYPPQQYGPPPGPYGAPQPGPYNQPPQPPQQRPPHTSWGQQ